MSPTKKYNCLLLISIFLLSTQALSEQILFDKSQIGDKTRFLYKWKNAESVINELDFELSTKNINNDFRHFKALTPSRLQTYSVKKLKQAIAKLDPRKGSVKIKQRYNRVEFEYRSTSSEWMEEQSSILNNLYNSSLEEFLYNEYYIEFEPIGYKGAPSNTTYKPDHVRFANESESSLAPIVTRLKKKLPKANARRTAAFLLSWIQSIPYNTLQSRAQSNGAGFAPPIQVISNNKGDCDSKVTLMASILKAMYPKLSIIIIYIPDHALIGFNVSHLDTDYKLQIGELDYTLAEPTGPGLIKFADIDERSKRFIESGLYEVENF